MSGPISRGVACGEAWFAVNSGSLRRNAAEDSAAPIAATERVGNIDLPRVEDASVCLDVAGVGCL